jgi:hypothetical protein
LAAAENHPIAGRGWPCQTWLMSGRPGAGGDPQLDFALLGPLRVRRGDVELDPGPRLQRTLLAILLTELRRVVPADRLIELLWGDAPPAAALASVQAYV